MNLLEWRKWARKGFCPREELQGPSIQRHFLPPATVVLFSDVVAYLCVFMPNTNKCLTSISNLHTRISTVCINPIKPHPTVPTPKECCALLRSLYLGCPDTRCPQSSDSYTPMPTLPHTPGTQSSQVRRTPPPSATARSAS